MNKLFLSAVMICLLAGIAVSKPAYEPLPEDLRLLSKKGIDAIYAVDIEEAEKNFNLALQKYPDHPFPHFGIAMAKWASLEYLEEESDPRLDKEYAQLTDKALEVGRKWIGKHPGDANAYLAMGGMHGLRARLAVLQHRWFKAYFEGKKAVSDTRKALRINPELYDAYLGLGLYEYYAGTLPGAIKFFASLLMPGDVRKGMAYLTLCKDKGYFNAFAAKLLLIEIYTQHGGKYANTELALKWSRELRAADPQRPQMHFIEIVSLYEDRKYGEALKETQEYLQDIYDQKPGYRKSFLPRIFTTLGDIYLAEKDYDKAVEYFSKAAATLKEDPARPPARWAVWGLAQLGNAYDLKGMRPKALEAYREAKAYKDNWGLTESIERFMKKPFTADALPVPIPPP
jgi:tetratricopeptide (TPR) repeat protein